MRRALVVAVLVCAALSPAVAEASSPHAQAALAKVKKLKQGKGVQTGFELSPALHELTAALPSLTGADRREAEAILARPDDTQADPEDTHKWSGPMARPPP